ncbi:MAG: FAD-dependent oxidoreductase, partial [Synechocystis sp.]
LIGDRQAPAAVIPLFNLTLDHPDWQYWQRYYLAPPDADPESGTGPVKVDLACLSFAQTQAVYDGKLRKQNDHSYQLILKSSGKKMALITERPEVYHQLNQLNNGEQITVGGRYNPAGNWLVVEAIAIGLN